MSGNNLNRAITMNESLQRGRLLIISFNKLLKNTLKKKKKNSKKIHRKKKEKKRTPSTVIFPENKAQSSAADWKRKLSRFLNTASILCCFVVSLWTVVRSPLKFSYKVEMTKDNSNKAFPSPENPSLSLTMTREMSRRLSQSSTIATAKSSAFQILRSEER